MFRPPRLSAEKEVFAAGREPGGEESKRKFGYSRDKRPDCVQVVIALIVTPEGSAGL